MHYYLSSSPQSSPTPAVSWLQLSACGLQLSHVVQALVAGLAGEGKRLGQLGTSTAPLSFHLIFLPDFLPAALDAATAGAGSCGRQVQCCYTPPLFSKTALAPCASSSGALSPALSHPAPSELTQPAACGCLSLFGVPRSRALPRAAGLRPERA